MTKLLLPVSKCPFCTEKQLLYFVSDAEIICLKCRNVWRLTEQVMKATDRIYPTPDAELMKKIDAQIAKINSEKEKLLHA